MAAGKVITGFSKPHVAVYAANEGTVTYSNGQVLARGVEVSISPESTDDNDFHADNVIAESDSGRFTGGELSLTVDGLLIAAERLIMGLPAAGEDGWTAYGDDQEAPNVGVGFVVRYMSDGVTTYVPIVVAKCKFKQPETSATTQGEEIDWQTTELTATIMRGDDAKHNWKYIGADVATEAEAEAALKTKLGITA